MLEAIHVEVASDDFTLMATAFTFPDGSRMRNAFAAPVVDEPIDASVFELTPGADWTVAEPLAN